MFRLIRVTERARARARNRRPMKMKLGMRKEGKKKERMRASHNAREEAAGKRKRDRITTGDKRDGKRQKTRDSKRRGGKERERVDVHQPPYPIDRHVLNPFPPVDSLLAVRLSSAKIQR